MNNNKAKDYVINPTPVKCYVQLGRKLVKDYLGYLASISTDNFRESSDFSPHNPIIFLFKGPIPIFVNKDCPYRRAQMAESQKKNDQEAG